MNCQFKNKTKHVSTYIYQTLEAIFFKFQKKIVYFRDDINCNFLYRNRKFLIKCHLTESGSIVLKLFINILTSGDVSANTLINF